uniref:Uncharacterized protein n=1 Tax=Magallana gigas TaxID=29159 RepID=K1PJB2_MAGGI
MGSKPSTEQEKQQRSASVPNVTKSHQNGVSGTDTPSSTRNPPKSAAPTLWSKMGEKDLEKC